jgi:D,D-heptose 1,7-bisphosphate phosphatase
MIPRLGDMLLNVQPAVFLDRDNTLVVGDDDVGDPANVCLMDGAAEGIRALRRAGYAIVVVTNQGGVARGRLTEEDVDAVNQRIAMLVDQEAGESHLIDRFYYCPYDPDAAIEEYRQDHPWRKPHPGMLLQAARDLHLDLARSWLIGDRVRDVQAGRAAGCRTVLLNNGQDHSLDGDVEATETVESFSEAVKAVLRSPVPTSPRDDLRRAAQSVADSPAGARTLDGTSIETQQAMHHGRTTGPSDVADDESAGGVASETRRMRRAVHELLEELRTERLHRSEFTALHLLAGVVQLLVLLCVLLGLLEIRNTDVFLKWMSGAVLIQLVVIALLIVDLRR